MAGTHALWPLMMGAIFFIMGYILIITCLAMAPALQTGSLYSQLSSQLGANGAVSSQMKMDQFSIFNDSINFDLSYNGAIVFKDFAEETDVAIRWVPDQFQLSLGFVPESFLFSNNNGFWKERTPLSDYGAQGYITPTDVLQNYDSTLNSSTIALYDTHISASVTWVSNDSSITLPTAFKNHNPVRIYILTTPNMESTSTNLWEALAKFFTFQTVNTGIQIIDLFTNLLVTIPVYIALFYTAYRLVSGLIPFASGGGGA
jgi:hypothetical protein